MSLWTWLARLGWPRPGANSLSHVSASWEALGQHDPMWAILSDPAKRGNRWEASDFFATGRVEVEQVLGLIAAIGIDLKRERALDFGAGLGRLTQGLAEHFHRVDGVDVSTSMIAGARRQNRHGDRVRYHVSQTDRLSFDDNTFDFVLSIIVLQHLPVAFQRLYVCEFLRVLKRGGVAVFQAVSQPVHVSGTRFESPVLTSRGRVTIDMNVFSRDEVLETITAAGGRARHVQPDGRGGENFESFTYVVTRAD